MIVCVDLVIEVIVVEVSVVNAVLVGNKVKVSRNVAGTILGTGIGVFVVNTLVGFGPGDLVAVGIGAIVGVKVNSGVLVAVNVSTEV